MNPPGYNLADKWTEWLVKPWTLLSCCFLGQFFGSGKFVLKNRDSCQTHGKGAVFEL